MELFSWRIEFLNSKVEGRCPSPRIILGFLLKQEGEGVVGGWLRGFLDQTDLF
jgi:hypothetical protein